MSVKKITITLIGLPLLCLVSSAKAKLSMEETRSLFNQANQYFRQANSTKDPDQARRLYEKAILGFERIINDGQIKNAKLYYNLGNAYFLKGQLGKAILNYRRAEKLGDYDENIQKNLAFARSKRLDRVNVKTEKRVLQTLFFWHYDFSIRTKFLLACIFFGVVCTCITVIIWSGRNAPCMVTAVICGILTICFLVSVVVESRALANRVCGVITAKEVVAHQGDGQNYPRSFKEPLHEGTEFELLESRSGWLHIRLFDGSDGWIPKVSAELI